MRDWLRAAASREPASPQAGRRNILVRYFTRFDDGEVMRWAFRGLLVGAIGVLALDLRELIQENEALAPDAAIPAQTAEPVLPPTVEGEGPAQSSDPREHVTTDEAVLRMPITFELEPGGVLSARGFIDPGAAQRFAEEIAARGEYVETVALNSPGGSLNDAMQMAELIREEGLATEVPDGALCASSCPLVMAGGKTRKAGEKSAVGVHQFYAVGAEAAAPAQAMADAQMTTARINRHLAEMGVDPALWLHALDTPPRALYYLSPEELSRYRLVTDDAPVAAAPRS
jgi:hypothetical protein